MMVNRLKTKHLCLFVLCVAPFVSDCRIDLPPDWVSEADAETVAFVNANVVPMDREVVLSDRTVVVQKGRIVQIGTSGDVPVPETITRVDASGMYLMPGLTEMHGHYPAPENAREFTEKILFLYVANGITLVRGMQGNEHHLPLRDAIARGEIVAPRLLVSSPPLSGNSVKDPEQAADLVRQYQAAGFDHLKVHENLSPEAYDAIAETARQAGIAFAGHVSNFVGLTHALSAGQATIDHLDNYVEATIEDQDKVRQPGLLTPAELVAEADPSKFASLAEATLEAGAGVVPTMVLWENFFGDTPIDQLTETTLGLAYVPPAMVQQWTRALENNRQNIGDPGLGAKLIALRRTLLAELAGSGVPVLLGTDSPQIFSVPGFSIHREMAVMVECGMTPYEVLAAGTLAVAKFYGAGDFGSVAEGMRADLILLRANPLDDVGNVAKRAGVMVGGRWLPEDVIQNRLAEIAASYQD